MELNQFLEKLQSVKKDSNGHSARCPAHEDSKASLCVSVGATGNLLMKCQAGCTTDAVVAALGLKMRDLFPKGAKQPERKVNGEPIATYDYRDEKGKLLFQVCRFEPKIFRQRHPDAKGKNGWTWGLGDVRRVLFRLPELKTAIQKGEPVFIAEGEKDVLALVKQGFAATCNAMGASKWKESYTESLKGADVVIVPDRDEPGKKHAALVASELRTAAKSIKVLELPDVAGKAVKDAHDFFAAGGTADTFRDLVNKTTPLADGSQAVTQPQKPAEIPEFHYDTEKGSYWRRIPGGFYVRCSETDLKRHMRFADVDVDSHTQNRMTRFDLAICKVQNEAGVDAVIALAGHKAGIFATADGRKILVPRSAKLIVPVRGLFPNLTTLHEELFGAEQLPYVLGWLKCAVEDMYSLNPHSWRHHQLLALVGKPNCGKSFYQSLITKILGGRAADPYLSIIGKSSFNEDLAEAEHLMMEDKNAHRDIKSRTAFGSSIKQLTVSKDMPCHGKGKKAILVPTYRRLSISINDDAEYITILPMLDDSVRDKLLIFHCGKATMLPDWKENMERFEKELPAFLWFLLNSHSIPEELKDVRFGIKSFHAPHVVELLEQFEPHLRLLEFIDITLFHGKAEVELVPWKGTATELCNALMAGPCATTARTLVTNSSAAGQYLAKLVERHPDRFLKPTVSRGIKKYTILAPR